MQTLHKAEKSPHSQKSLVVFLDCGDTLVDESKQEWSEERIVQRAKAIPGAGQMLETLYRSGYSMALVADGKAQSFRNILDDLGFARYFKAFIISEEVGCTKPDQRMFLAAMEQIGLGEEDIPRIVMVGNNLERDIVGANRMGITSVLLSYSPRYRMQPQCADEIPDYVIAMPMELPPLLDQLEIQLGNRRVLYAKEEENT